MGVGRDELRARQERLRDLLDRARRMSPDGAGSAALAAIGAQVDITPLDAGVEPTRQHFARLAQAEAIIFPKIRPALEIRDGDYPGSPPPPWAHLAADPYHMAIRRAARSVGRIEAPSLGTLHLGTGFLVAPTLLLTNRHVADRITHGRGLAVRMREDAKPRVNFLREVARPDLGGEASRAITDVVFVHPYWDAALFRVAAGPVALPAVSMRTRPLDNLKGRQIALVGYPARDPALPSSIAQQVFNGPLDIKRFQPGEILGTESVILDGTLVEDAILHDASSLGGSSGSPVIDLCRLVDNAPIPDGFSQILALHSSGDQPPARANYAIPLWLLFSDRLLFSPTEGRLPEIRKELKLDDAIGKDATPWDDEWTPELLARPPGAPATPTVTSQPPAPETPDSGCEGASDAPPPDSAPPDRSGVHWVTRYPESASLASLSPGFRENVSRFVEALKRADCTVEVLATWRPPERAWLMRWCCLVAGQQVSPQAVPVHPCIPVRWWHGDFETSRQAAAAMMAAYGIQRAPGLSSRHTEGRALDLRASWLAPFEVRDPQGNLHQIPPGDSATSVELRALGAAFGVHKHPTDPNHWSEDGT